VKHLKKNLGEDKYKQIINLDKNNIKVTSNDLEKFDFNREIGSDEKKEFIYQNQSSEELFPLSPFFEITPLNCEIENSAQKDLSSVPISEIDFPQVVYMIVDKKIELETKYLKEYPRWQFLSQEELNRKTIEIFLDMKIAKRFCNKEQKVIKVPNTDVFKIVAPILLKKGISRIVSEDKLISLWEFYSLWLIKLMFKILPDKEPQIKLVPMMKLIGNLIVSLIIKLTFFWEELFCIPMINIKNREKLNVIAKNNFLKGNDILNFY